MTRARPSLHALLRERRTAILDAWEALAAADLGPPHAGASALRGRVPEAVDGLAAWLGSGELPPAERLRAIVLEAVAGVEHPGDLAHLVHEVGLVRSAILRALSAPDAPALGAVTAPELARLNAGIDGAISDAVERFVATRERRIAALVAAERRYTELVQLSPEAILVHRRGRVEAANPAAVALFGAATEGDLLGKTPFDLVHPADQEAVQARVQRLLRGEARLASGLAMRIVRLDGRARRVEAAAAVCDERNGRAIQIVLRDAPRRRRPSPLSTEDACRT